MSLKEARKNYRDAKEAYENNPTPENETAMMGAKEAVVMLISIVIISYLIGPTVMALVEINTTGWPTGAASLITALPLIVVAVIVMKFID